MWSAIPYFLAGIVALSGVFLAYHYSAKISNRRIWLVIAGALLIFTAFVALLAFSTISEQSGLVIDLIAGLLALLFAGLAVYGIWRVGQRSQALEAAQLNARKECELLHSVVDYLPIPVAIKDRELVYRAANPSFEKFLGKQQSEIIGKKASDFFPRPQANAFQHAEELLLQEGSVQIQEHELSSADGKKWMEITRTPIEGRNGDISGILISSQDITIRKQLEREIEEQKLLVNALVEEKMDTLEEKQSALDAQNALLEFERLLVLVASNFIDSNPDRIDHGLNHALQLIGMQTCVDRCQVLLYEPGRGDLRIAYEWVAQDLQSTIQGDNNLPAADQSWMNLGQMQVIHVPSLSRLPANSYEIAQFMREAGIVSFTAVPLISGRSAIGYFLLVSLHQEISWGTDFLDLLKSASGIFVQALDRKRSAEAILAEQETTQKDLETLRQHNLENTLLSELGDLLQVCRTVDEAYPVIARYTQQLVPVGSGALYLSRDSSDPVERVAAWGDAQPVETELAINECWALRRGRLHLVKDSKTDLNCAHLKAPLPKKYLCIPLIAQGETIGLLHLRPAKGETASLASRLEDYLRVSQVIAEQIALALSNLSLRDKLRSQAIRDPLTGLFNRRYMEETLEREIRRAVRHTTPVSAIMFDVDFLKKINDSYGHDAGDVVLKALGSLMMKIFRGEDVPCRYGGDEFTIILPEATVSEAFRRAEQFREAFKDIIFEHEGKRFGPLTLSLGIAAYPDHGASVDRLMQTADAAAYAAKVQGRDRVMIGGITEE